MAATGGGGGGTTTGALPFNKMFVMIPIMLAARKLDGEDPHIVWMLRVAYAVMQVLCVAVVLYTYLMAQRAAASAVAATTSGRGRIVYVPAAAQVRELFPIWNRSTQLNLEQAYPL